MAEWHNWTGDQRCLPARIEKPADRADLIEAVRRASDQRLTVRAVGSGHSFTDTACTGGVLIEMEGLTRMLDVARDSGLIKVEARIPKHRARALVWRYRA